MKPIHLILIFFIVSQSCKKESTSESNLPDLTIVIKSKNNDSYYAFMNYPRYYSLNDVNINEKNTFPVYFSIQSDSSEYTIKSITNRKEYYFSLKCNHRIVEDYSKRNQFIQFFNISVTDCSADSFKLINDELWLYCD